MRRFISLIIFLLITSAVQAQTGLNDYLEIAARENPTLKAKFNLYLAALERVNQQGALPDPNLSFGYFISPVETRVGPQRFRLSVSQMFPWMGTLKAREKAAASLAKAKFEMFQEARNQLFLQVKSKWLALYELQKEIQIMEENLDILRSYEPVTKTKYEANLVSLADLVRVQISIDRAKTELELLRLKEKPLKHDFNTMLHRDGEMPIVISDTLKQEKVDFEFDAVMEDQPRLRAIKSNLSALEQEKVLADLGRKPNIGLGLDYGLIAKREGVNIPDNGKDILVPQVNISLPIFGKKNRSVQKEADLKMKAKGFELAALEDELKNSWIGIEYELEAASQSLALYSDEMKKTEVLLNVLISEYTNNNQDFEKLLETQQRLLQLQLANVRTGVLYQQAVFKQEYLTGSTLNEIQNEIK
ncbi:TolC family protein [Roseivirga sp. E12]|uniref:TolC family protein n=1 Tax=Roseivirga sp. E12 TaxID=2819237 RepID=UPI001ABC9AA6|nr:TolC family protein [Roseivirga sp. E12]MBO3700734.1 TolC family protein [Roseivirga sp. E12]